MRRTMSRSALRRIRAIVISIVLVLAMGGVFYYIFAVKSGMRSFYEARLSEIESELEDYKQRFEVAISQGDQLRLVEYTCIDLPEGLAEGDYVDVRILYPDGQDQVVLSHKKVCQLELFHGLTGLMVDDDEIQRMDLAGVDLRFNEGSRLYMTRYINPGIQQASAISFVGRGVASTAKDCS